MFILKLNEEANARTTRTCSTVNYLEVTKLPVSTTFKDLYFYHASETRATRDGGGTSFYIGIAEDDYGVPAIGTSLAPFLTDIIHNDRGYVNISVTGDNDSGNNSEKYYDSQQIKEATPVLQSIKLTTE